MYTRFMQRKLQDTEPIIVQWLSDHASWHFSLLHVDKVPQLV